MNRPHTGGHEWSPTVTGGQFVDSASPRDRWNDRDLGGMSRSFTRQRPLVRTQYRPLDVAAGQRTMLRSVLLTRVRSHCSSQARGQPRRDPITEERARYDLGEPSPEILEAVDPPAQPTQRWSPRCSSIGWSTVGSVATYECAACGMSVNATCGHCDAPLVNEVLTRDDGSTVQVSKCPNDHGKIKSPLCCGTDMACTI